jgi:hypothetical protein
MQSPRSASWSAGYRAGTPSPSSGSLDAGWLMSLQQQSQPWGVTPHSSSSRSRSAGTFSGMHNHMLAELCCCWHMASRSFRPKHSVLPRQLPHPETCVLLTLSCVPRPCCVRAVPSAHQHNTKQRAVEQHRTPCPEQHRTPHLKPSWLTLSCVPLPCCPAHNNFSSTSYQQT